MTTPGHLDKRGSPLDIACCHCGRCLIEGRQFGRRFGSRVQGGNNWQCRLTSGKVVADRLSRHTRVTPDADQIVDALKRKTQLMAKTPNAAIVASSALATKAPRAQQQPVRAAVLPAAIRR